MKKTKNIITAEKKDEVVKLEELMATITPLKKSFLHGLLVGWSMPKDKTIA